MSVIEWMYGTAISGISFPMITASGTLANGYDPATMSTVLSKDGGAWSAISGRMSGIPGNGWYTLASLSSTEMTCTTWAIKITANSGCLDQGIIGVNKSGVLSGLAGVLAAVSGVPDGVGSIKTTTSTVLASGTLAHDSRLMRRFAWGDLTIDKRYTPYRMYLEDDAGNMSGYFDLTDDSNTTVRDKA